MRTNTYMAQVRLQTQPHGAGRKSMAQMVLHVLKADGVPGLYRGVSRPSTAPHTAAATDKIAHCVALSLPPPPGHLQHHSLRRL